VKYLTKSRFKLAAECPTKLFYTGKKIYANKSLDNPFLEALADGGFQVGELAKYYYPNGYNVISLDYDEALKQTNKLLEQNNVTIFEAAIKFKDLFIRVDILFKRGSQIRIIEVKSKSIDERMGDSFLTKNGDGILAEWKPYLYDVCFQRHVLKSAFPKSNVTSFLLLANKEARAPSDGINQKFQIFENKNHRKGVEVSSSLNHDDLSVKLLCEVPVDYYCDLLLSSAYTENIFGFERQINTYSESYSNDVKTKPLLKKECRDCEFKATQEEINNGLISGYQECWKDVLGWQDSEFEKPNVLNIWDHRKKDELIAKGKIKFSDFNEEDINPKMLRGDNELERVERQWLQIEKVQNNDSSIFLNKEGLQKEIDSWTYPLNFIDFETSTVAIPFNKGRKPYEGIAFQYSHHIVHENGLIEHKGEYLNSEEGVFPNYDFLRNLKKGLENNNGTIFRYHNHENTYLNIVYRQLQDEEEISDKDALCSFIKDITKSKNGATEKWLGARNMVDLWVLIKKYYYNPATNGSNSLKDVLPATINSSYFLKKKYSQPIYGTSSMPSLNFNNHQWIEINDGIASNPYEKLIISNFYEGADICENQINTDGIKDGGAAMMAYAKLQFDYMENEERKELQDNLLRYCELDTLAMVMIYEAWINWIQ